MRLKKFSGGHDSVVSTGPLPSSVTAELESLKLRLMALQPEEMPEVEADAIAAEISAIRLQLKRLEADREWVKDVAARATQS